MEVGQVIDVKDDQVVLQMVRNAACGSCHACSMGAEGQTMRLQALNLCNAQKNDMVEIRLDSDSFLSAVGILYGIPLIFLLLGIIGGVFLGEMFLPAQKELIAIALGLGLTAMSFLVIKSREKSFRKEKYAPKAVRVVEPTELLEQADS